MRQDAANPDSVPASSDDSHDALSVVRPSTPRAVTLTEPVHLHFLCNTLHIVQGLVHRDPDRVERMLDELSELLHHLLHSTRVGDVPLRDEVEALQAYANLQKERFAERLDVSFDVEPAALDRRVPGFIVYPLIENAVKFGLQTGPMPVQVRISARVDGGRLRIEVANTGRWLEAGNGERSERGNGFALESLRERLAATFPGRHRFLVSEEEGWVRVTLEIPG